MKGRGVVVGEVIHLGGESRRHAAPPGEDSAEHPDCG